MLAVVQQARSWDFPLKWPFVGERASERASDERARLPTGWLTRRRRRSSASSLAGTRAANEPLPP